MPCRLIFRSAGIFFLLGCLGFSNAAWAGFQWVAPTEPLPPANDTVIVPPSSGSLQMPSAPLSSSSLQSTGPEVITPLVIQGSANSQNAAESPVYNGAPIELHPMHPSLPVAGNNVRKRGVAAADSSRQTHRDPKKLSADLRSLCLWPSP